MKTFTNQAKTMLLLALLLAGNLLSGRSYGQTIRYVKPTASGTGDGTSWANASGDLQAMIDATGINQVWMANGTYTPGATLSMRNGVAIYGGFVGTETTLTARTLTAPLSTTILGGGVRLVFSNTNLNNTALLDGFVIAGGKSTNGGGMFNVSSSPTLTNCSFQNNTATNGGGMFNVSSSPTLTNCSFQNNTATQSGGGMYNQSSSPTLTNCSFQNNTASILGGGMLNAFSSSPTLTNCSFQNNTATFGGGMSNENSSPTLTNCSFQNNTATNGGGMLNQSSSPTLTNCVVFGNGGNNTFFNNNSTLTATYSLFDNTVAGYGGSNNLTTTVNPFASTTSVALNSCSEAINAGNNAAYNALTNPPATDLAGNARVFPGNGTIDMGAVEFQTTPNFPVAVTSQPVASSAVCVGGAATASVSVTGTGPLSYQWYKDSFASPVASQTTATLSLTGLVTAEAGSYSVVVTGACNSVTSTAFSLTVNSAPTNLSLTGGTLTCGTPSLTLTASATNGTSFTFSGGTLLGSNQVVVDQPGSYSVTVSTVNGCTAMTSTSISSDTAAPTNASLTSGTLTCTQTSLTLTASSPGGTTYRFSAGTPLGSNQVVVGQAGTYTVTVSNANGCSATATATVVSNTAAPTASLMASSSAFCSGSPATLTASGGTGYAFSGPGLSQSGTSNTATASQGGNYSVIISSANGCTASAGVSLGLTAPTIITAPPASASVVCVGAPVSVSVGAIGQNLIYQWYRGATLLGGQREPVLRLLAAQPGDAGSYSVVVTGGCGSVTSTGFSLIVNALPVVTLSLLNNGAVLQATGGVLYERLIVVDRIGSYEIRQTDSSSHGFFNITRSGPFRLTVTGANGCRALVDSNTADLPR